MPKGPSQVLRCSAGIKDSKKGWKILGNNHTCHCFFFFLQGSDVNAGDLVRACVQEDLYNIISAKAVIFSQPKGKNILALTLSLHA